MDKMAKPDYNRSGPSAGVMNIEKLILVIASLCVVVGIPLGITLRGRAMQLKQDVNHRRELEFKIDLKQQELNDAAAKVETSGESIEKLEQEKRNLEVERNKYKSDAEAKAKSKIIIAKAQAAVVTTPKPKPVKVDCENYRAEIVKYFPASQVANAMRVMNAESGCNPGAHNPTDGHRTCLGSRGLFQIGCDSTPFYGNMFESTANIQQAAAMHARRGWQPWSVSKIPGVIQ